MASDLAVNNIGLPPTVVAPCPTPVDVEIINVGTDPAPLPTSVCLAVLPGTGDTVLSEFVEAVRGSEGQVLPPMGKATVRFFVSFPCAAQARLRATADCRPPKVPNNAATTPSMDVLVQPIAGAPWLATDFRLGLRDSVGGTTWNPAQLCSRATLIVEARITNKGCASAPPSVTELELSDGGGNVLTARKQVTPTIAAGATAVVTFLTQMPTSGPVPLSSVVISVCADSTNVVTGQCDRASLCKTISRPVITQAGAPSVSFSVGGYQRPGAIRPGEPVGVNWSIANHCEDLGLVTATIQLSGTDLYTSGQLPVPPLGSNGENYVSIPKVTDPAIAAAFYKIGSTHTLDLRVNASGSDPGPYRASASITVQPDSPPSWTWLGADFTASWKRQYAVTGELFNDAIAAITPTRISIRERPAAPTTGPSVLTPADPFSTSQVPSRASLTAGLSGIRQQWPWTQGPLWSMTGPTSRTFAYSAEFDVVDEYGNVYSNITSTFEREVRVRVATKKLQFQINANVQASAAGGAFITAAGLALINPVAAALVLEFAWLMWGLSIWNGAQAEDPPVPDFRYDERVEVEFPTVPMSDEAGDTVVALGRVLELAVRIRGAQEALGKIHGKLLGASIDRAAGPLLAQADRYRDVSRIMSQTSSFLPDVTAEAIERLSHDDSFREARLTEALESLRAEGPPDALRALARERGLPDDALPTLNDATRRLTSVPDLPTLLRQQAAALRAVTAEIEAEAPSILALAELEEP